MGDAAVFLDRDGTINNDPGYIGNPDDVALIGNSARAIRLLNAAGLKVIVLTNQSGIGRGYFKHKDLDAVHERIKELLRLEGAHVDGIYYCPHRPDEECGCRKPATGLIEKAASEHAINPSRSYLVGDKCSDMELARRVGARGVLVLTGKGGEEFERLKREPDFIARNLFEAAGWILGRVISGE